MSKLPKADHHISSSPANTIFRKFRCCKYLLSMRRSACSHQTRHPPGFQEYQVSLVARWWMCWTGTRLYKGDWKQFCCFNCQILTLVPKLDNQFSIVQVQIQKLPWATLRLQAKYIILQEWIPPWWPVICSKIMFEMTQDAKSAELSLCGNLNNRCLLRRSIRI